MGNHTSQYMRNQIEVLNQTMISAETKIENRGDQDCQTVQDITITVGKGGSVDGGLKAHNTTQILCTFTMKGISDMQADMINNINNKIDEIYDQSNDTTQEALATTFNVSGQTIDLKKFIKNEFKASIENSVNNQCRQNIYAKQSTKVTILGRVTGGLDLNNQAQAIGVSTCIFDTAATAIVKNETANDLLTQIEQANKTQQTGLASILKAWSTWLIAAAVLLVVIAVIYFGIKAKAGGKGKVSDISAAVSSIGTSIK